MSLLLAHQADRFLSSFDSQSQRVIGDVCLAIDQKNPEALYENLNTWCELMREDSQSERWTVYFDLLLMALLKKDRLLELEVLLLDGLKSQQAARYPLVLEYCLNTPRLAAIFSERFYLLMLSFSSKRYQVLRALFLQNNPKLLSSPVFSQLNATGQWLSLNDLCRTPGAVLPLSLLTRYILNYYAKDPDFCVQLLSLFLHANDYPVYYYTIIKHVLTQTPSPEAEPVMKILQSLYTLWRDDYQTNFVEPRIAFTHWALAALSCAPNPIAQVFSSILLFAERNLPRVAELKVTTVSETRSFPRSFKAVLWLKDSALGKTVLGIKALMTDTVDELNETYDNDYYQKIQGLKASDLQYFPKEVSVSAQIEKADKVALAQYIDMKQGIETLFSSTSHQNWLKKIDPDFPFEPMRADFSSILARHLHWLVILNASHTDRVSYLFAKLKIFVDKCEAVRQQLDTFRDQGFILSAEAETHYQKIMHKMLPALKEIEFSLKESPATQLYQDKTLQRFKKKLLALFIEDYVLLKAWFYQAKSLEQQLGSKEQIHNMMLHRWLYGLVDSQHDGGGSDDRDYTAVYLPKFQSMVQSAPSVDLLIQKLEPTMSLLRLQSN